MKKKICAILAIALATTTVLIGCGKQGQGSDPAPGGQSQRGETESGQLASSQSAQQESGQDELLSGKHHVKINIKDMGTIEVELDRNRNRVPTFLSFFNNFPGMPG